MRWSKNWMAQVQERLGGNGYKGGPARWAINTLVYIPARERFEVIKVRRFLVVREMNR